MNKLITTTLIIGILASMAGMTACSSKQPIEPQTEATEPQVEAQESVELEAEKETEEATEPQEEETTNEVTEVILDSAEITLKIGDVMGIKATVEPQEAIDKTVTFASDNTAIATVDEQGVVTAVGAGETSIVAKATNGVLSAVKVVVAEPQAEVTEETAQPKQDSTPKEETPQQEKKAPKVEEEAQPKAETAPKKSTGGVDKDGFPLNPHNDQIVEIDGQEYLYDAGLEIWMEYLGENEITIWDNDGEEYLNSPQI